MIICDRCRSLEVPAHQVSIAILKEERKANGKKPAEREMKRFPLHLCESCITASFSTIGKAIDGIHEEVKA